MGPSAGGARIGLIWVAATRLSGRPTRAASAARRHEPRRYGRGFRTQGPWREGRGPASANPSKYARRRPVSSTRGVEPKQERMGLGDRPLLTLRLPRLTFGTSGRQDAATTDAAATNT